MLTHVLNPMNLKAFFRMILTWINTAVIAVIVGFAIYEAVLTVNGMFWIRIVFFWLGAAGFGFALGRFRKILPHLDRIAMLLAVYWLFRGLLIHLLYTDWILWGTMLTLFWAGVKIRTLTIRGYRQPFVFAEPILFLLLMTEYLHLAYVPPMGLESIIAMWTIGIPLGVIAAATARTFGRKGTVWLTWVSVIVWAIAALTVVLSRAPVLPVVLYGFVLTIALTVVSLFPPSGS